MVIYLRLTQVSEKNLFFAASEIGPLLTATIDYFVLPASKI